MSGTGSGSFVGLLPFRPHPYFAGALELDVNKVWAATDGAALDVFLTRSRRQIGWDDNLLATCFEVVFGFVSHPLHPFNEILPPFICPS
jgi:hypothetical protein